MDIFNCCKLIGDKYYIKNTIKYFGMKKILENTIEVVKELGDDDYLLTLRCNLETTLEEYNNRYGDDYE